MSSEIGLGRQAAMSNEQRNLFGEACASLESDAKPKPRAPVAWYGGKAYYADWIIETFPAHRVYVEPFGGAANVLLRKALSEVEVYNDIDDRVVNLFRVLRDPALFERLRIGLDLTPYARGEFAAVIDAEASADPVENARRFFVACRQARGGIGMSKLTKNFWAFSKRTRRGMAEPVSKYLSSIEGLVDVAERFRTVMIESRPALELISRYDGPDTLFYMDPPYLPDTRYAGKASTYAFEMSREEHAELVTAIIAARGKVVLSGYANDLYGEMLAGWRSEKRRTKSFMSNSGKEREEILWMNF